MCLCNSKSLPRYFCTVNLAHQWVAMTVNGVQQGVACVQVCGYSISAQYPEASLLVTILSTSGFISIIAGIGLMLYRKYGDKTIKNLEAGVPPGKVLGGSFRNRVEYLERCSERKREKILFAIANQAKMPKRRKETFFELEKLAWAETNFTKSVVNQIERLAITENGTVASLSVESLARIRNVKGARENVDLALQNIANSDSKAAGIAMEKINAFERPEDEETPVIEANETDAVSSS